MAKEMAKQWPTLEIDRRDLPLIVNIAAKNSQFRDFELTVMEVHPGKIRARIRKIAFGGRVETSSEWLEG